MLIKIDYREHGIIEKVNSNNYPKWYTIQNPSEIQEVLGVTFKVETLEVGDFHFEKAGKLYLAVERKTEADLQSSLRDGRWREQKERLDILRLHGTKVLFLIEQVDVCKTSFIDFKLNQGAIINTLLRDEYPILYSKGLDETIEYLEMIYKKIEKGDFEKQMGSSLQTSASSVKKKLSTTNFFLTCLSSIPRVSLDIANKIQNEYINLDKLLIAYKEEGKYVLAELELGKDGKKRKLGRKLSTDIYNFLFGLEEKDI